MMANPSVLLPEPLGPIRAWISPRRIERLTPFKIGLPATWTCKSLIAKTSLMSRFSSLGS